MKSETLQARLEEYERIRCEMLDRVGGLDERQLTDKASPEEWSVQEIVEHLVICEWWILQNLPEPSALVARNQTPKDRLMYRIVMFVLKYRISVPVPGADGLPKGEMSLPALRGRWEESQQWLRNHVNALAATGKDPAVFAHPVAGPLTAAQAIHMGLLHLKYHDRQIRNRSSR